MQNTGFVKESTDGCGSFFFVFIFKKKVCLGVCSVCMCAGV